MIYILETMASILYNRKLYPSAQHSIEDFFPENDLSM